MRARRGEFDFSDQSKLEISSFFIKRPFLRLDITLMLIIILVKKLTYSFESMTDNNLPFSFTAAF
jgi:hypothetical protein